MKFSVAILIKLLALILWSGCGSSQREADKPEPVPEPEVRLNLNIIRFEKDLFQHRDSISPALITSYRIRYGRFFELWCSQLAGILPPDTRNPDNDEIMYNLRQYMADRYIREVFSDCEKTFSDLEPLEAELESMFSRYTVAFPGKPIPRLVSYVSPFTSQVMTMDSTLGIGLHFYLGANYNYYSTLQLPRYMIRKMRKEYMTVDLLKGWLDSEYLNDSAQRNMLAQMIYQGKLLYAMDVLLPEISDTIKTGYSASQWEWVRQNEEKIWSFFIEQKLLYSTNPKTYIKYIQDGNTTGGFPEKAPARLGAYIGWQIVRAYMLKNPTTRLDQLFQLSDAQTLLAGSGYRPPKPSS